MSRSSFLTTYDLAVLDNACKVINAAWPYHTYLVGSAGESGDYRDVDVRTIIPDEEFDRIFAGGDGASGQQMWELVCMGITAHLRAATGLPIDYQIQRRTEANEKHKGSRNPLGISERNRFAGGGDATRFVDSEGDDNPEAPA